LNFVLNEGIQALEYVLEDHVALLTLGDPEKRI
jgi:hypothetical protein